MSRPCRRQSYDLQQHRVKVTNPPGVPNIPIQVQVLPAFDFKRAMSAQRFKHVGDTEILRNPEAFCMSV